MPERNVTPDHCGELRAKCHEELSKRFVSKGAFRGIVATLITFIGFSFGWAWGLHVASGSRATVSEDKAGIAQREADKILGRVDSIPSSFAAIAIVIQKIENAQGIAAVAQAQAAIDIALVKDALARLEKTAAHNIGSTSRPDLK